MPEKVLDLIKKCDSWSNVEDNSATEKYAKYAVTVFFQTEDEAREFYGQLAEISSRP